MIQFFKELYLAGFAVLFRVPRWGNTRTKIGRAVTGVALIEWLILAGISSWIDIFIGTRFLLGDSNSLTLSKLIFLILFFALYFANYRILVTHGHGVEFEHEFKNLEKSKKILLMMSCVLLLVAGIAFFLYSRLAYRHFFHINS